MITSRQILDMVISQFSDVNPASFFVSQYGYNVQSRISPINQFGFFPTGLIFELLRYLKLHYGSLDVIEMSKNCRKYINDWLVPLRDWAKTVDFNTFEPSNVSDDTGRNDELEKSGKQRYKMRDYQSNAIKHLLLKGLGRGLIELPTASGKSFSLANLIWTLDKQYKSGMKYLVYVPNRQLVDQMYKDFLDYGYPQELVTRLSSGLKKNERFNPDAMVIVSNRQYLFKNMDMLPKIDVLINDEVHQSCAEKSNTFNFINGLECRFKFGCSGTLPRNRIEMWNLQSVFCRKVYAEEITDLQSRGFISKLKIDSIKIVDNVVKNDRNLLFNLNPIRRFSKDRPDDILFDQAYRDEIEYMDKHYKDLYTPILEKISMYNGNMLILFDRIEFGKNMFDLACEMGIRGSSFYYIDGSIDVKERERIREEFEKSDNNILFAQSTTFSTGISIKRLSNIVFFFSGKGFSKILQSVGRTLRLHKDKEYAQLVDISFNFKYSRKHLTERREIYRESYGKHEFDREFVLEV